MPLEKSRTPTATRPEAEGSAAVQRGGHIVDATPTVTMMKGLAQKNVKMKVDSDKLMKTKGE
ncbi:MAG: hypothetical protein ABSG32_27255 [Terriglobia bacterium]|jgi:hypothetical protein